MKPQKAALIILTTLLVASCETTTLIPPIGNMQTVIANASTENEAVKMANARANNICVLQNQKIKIIDLDTSYHGNDPDQKALVNLAKKILPENKTSGPYHPENYTYKATLTFRCI